MRNKFLIIVFLAIISALCVIGFSACGQETGDVDENYATWKDSDLAEDYNGDRRITEEDYEIYKGYKVWKNSDKAYDYNGDKKINFDDYIFLKDPETADFATWIVSDSAYDYDGDRRITEEDYEIYKCYNEWKNSDKAYDYNGDKKINFDDYLYEYNYKCLIGKFKVVNFNGTSNGTIYLNRNYNLNNLAHDIGDFDFEVSTGLKLTCTYGETVKQKLGNEEVAVQDAINSCEFEKLSDYVITASFTIQRLPFTVYLTKTESGFSSSVRVTVYGITANITFDIVYVK